MRKARLSMAHSTVNVKWLVLIIFYIQPSLFKPLIQ
jgi:hypothetical protein